MNWLPIESCPATGFFLVYEDGAIRTMFRIDGVWKSPAYAALVSESWPDDAVVGNDAKRLLPPGYRLAVREICIDPTHWQPLPPPPTEPGAA